jgi:[ribosomal protein S5]-alanine N-acetyltransferase
MSITIREHVASDLDAYCEWQMSAACARWISWLPKSRRESEASLMDAIREQSRSPRQKFFFAVCDDASASIVGDVGFTIVGHAIADCGWFIRERFWRHGFATDAGRLMVDYAFTRTHMETLIASCSELNQGSRRVAEKCGFHESSRDAGRIRFQLNRGEWKERQPNQALQTTSVTRSGFGKVPVSDRQRRGV